MIGQRMGSRLVLAVAVGLLLTVAVGVGPAAARGGTAWRYTCGSYHTYTVNGDTIHYKACVSDAYNGNYRAAVISYVSGYDASPAITLYRSRVWYYSPGGTLLGDGTCEWTSVPTDSAHPYLCASTTSGSGNANYYAKGYINPYYGSNSYVTPIIQFTR
jgi:hypothetical protein